MARKKIANANNFNRRINLKSFDSNWEPNLHAAGSQARSLSSPVQEEAKGSGEYSACDPEEEESRARRGCAHSLGAPTRTPGGERPKRHLPPPPQAASTGLLPQRPA